MKQILIVIMLCSFLASALAQAPARRPAFDAASVKPMDYEGTDSDSSPGYLHLQGTLKSIIRIAYDVREDQVQGGPKWIDQDHYEIEARAEGPAKSPELMEMLQTLLAERFK